MNDIYLGKRESNRGCYVLAVAALLIGLLAWFVFAYSPKKGSDDPNRSNTAGTTNSGNSGNSGVGGENGDHTVLGITGTTPGGGPGTQIAPPPPPLDSPGMTVSRPGAEPPPTATRTPTPLPRGTASAPRPGSQRTPAQRPQPTVKETKETNPDLTAAIKNARIHLSRGDDINARRWAVQAWDNTQSTITRREAEQVLDNIHSRALKGQADLDEMEVHRVRSGEVLSTICKRYGTTPETIMRMNDLSSPNRIRAGQRLNVIKGRWHVEVDLSEHSLVLKLNGHYFKRYPVGVGRIDKPTPIGEFVIVEKQENPDWYSTNGKIPFGDPRNELGTRWMGWDKDSYGIHGTNDPATIGTSCSSGCVRLYDEDVEELFDLLPYKTQVLVRR